MLGSDMRGFLLAGGGLLAAYWAVGALGLPRLATVLAFATGALYLAFGGGGAYLVKLLGGGEPARGRE